jgi:GDPmannose 4,6-dehydratase
MRLLDAIRWRSPEAKSFQASSSEVFGKVTETPQAEKTPFHPRRPYGVAKAFGHNITESYRESYRLEFVSHKITQHVARIKLGLIDKLKMGNLNVQRDWGYAGDYIRAMRLAIQQPEPDDYVVATEVMHSMQQLLEVAFSCVGLNWKAPVGIGPKLVRPAEVDYLCGNATKARKILGWSSEVSFRQLVELMVEADIQALRGNKSASGALSIAV